MLKVVVTSVGTPYEHTLTVRHHTLVTDAPKSLKGGDKGASPHELALFALGACSAITMEMKAAKRKWDLRKVTVTVTEDTVPDPSDTTKTIPRITEDIEIEGNLTQVEIDGLKKAAEECPVLQLMLKPKVIETKVTLVGSAAAGPAVGAASGDSGTTGTKA